MISIRKTTALAITLSLAFSSCAATEPAVSVEDWTPEKILFPPNFAPHFGMGEENILFAPGMFKVGDEGFWSYALVIDVDQALDTKGTTTQFLEDYYDGLLRLVGKNRDRFVPDPATVKLVELGEGQDRSWEKKHYEGTISILDAFVTGDRVDLIADVAVESLDDGRTHMEVMVSPQQRDHPIWRSLAAAITELRDLDPGS